MKSQLSSRLRSAVPLVKTQLSSRLRSAVPLLVNSAVASDVRLKPIFHDASSRAL